MILFTRVKAENVPSIVIKAPAPQRKTAKSSG
jgi:hypothetical protein